MEKYIPFFEDNDITKTPQFKKWFGKSKVVDKSGKPLVVYHGTNSSFSAFKGVTYFAVDESEAKAYAKHRHEGGTSKVVGVYLSIQNPADENDLLGVARSLKVYDEGQSIAELADNPKVVNTLKAKGFDGIMGLWDYGFISDFNQIEVIVAFYPNQIKSATDNNGEFNKNSHSIYESQDDIKIGDTVLVGKFKNKRAIVTGFGVDKNNQPTVITDKGEMSLYHVRIDKLMKEEINKSDYLKWKKKNVTYRGIKSIGQDNEVYGSWGKGLYTVPLSNKVMAKQYGKVYFVVGATPKKPKIVNGINQAEIYRQELIVNFCKKYNKDYDLRFFEENTSMDKELTKLGFDGFVIKGREMVNYLPENVKYFETENQLIQHYETVILNESINRYVSYFVEDFQLSLLPTSSGKYGVWDYIGKQRVYKKGSTSPIYFDTIDDAKKYAISYMNKKYGKKDWKFEESNDIRPFMNRESHDLFRKYKNDWKYASTWESFVKTNQNIFNKEVGILKDSLSRISNEVTRNKKFVLEMRQLTLLLTDIWKNIKHNNVLDEAVLLEEDIKISDLMKASMSALTRKFNKETNKLMGNPTNHTKLVQAKANKTKDYIDFFWVTERTPKYKDNFHLQKVDFKNWKLRKDNLYTIQLRLEGFFSILDLKTNPNPSDADIESAFWLSKALIWDDTPMFHYQGANFNLSLLDGSLHPTDIAPKFWNKYHNSDQFLSKHSAGIFQSIKFYIPQMRQIVKKYLNKKK